MQPLTQLGKYTILERVGQGAYGVVYRAHDKDLDRDVALKVLHPFLVQEPGVLERFWREARAMARLHHPGIVPIYEVGHEQGLFFLAERYVPGPTLEHVLERGPLPLEKAIALTEQLAAALDYAHGRGFLHRDVKPANIMLDEETGQAALTDFGLARALESSGSSIGVVGTPAYIPPEIWENEPPDARTDVYALAVVAYEMLAGRVPFDRDTPAATMRAHLTQEAPFPPDLEAVFPPPVRDVLRRGLAKRREDRYLSAGTLAADLRQVATPPVVEPVKPTPPPEPRPAPLPSLPSGEGPGVREARHWPTWIVGIGAAVLVLVLCLVMLVGMAVKGGPPTPTQAVHAVTNRPTFTPVPPTATPTPTATRTPKPTALPATIRGKDGKEIVLVPAGEFLMGSTDADSDAQSVEKPQHKVYLNAFYMDKTEVTNAEYKRFVDATGHRTPDHWTNGQVPAGLENHPVANVSWDDAAAYAKWAGKRLPTEAEWEKAARGTDGRIYPWGNEWDGNKCNSWDGGPHKTTAAGSYPAGASPYGVLDMAGNVWEWCADQYDETYYQKSSAKNPAGPDWGSYRVLRGGSWSGGRTGVRAALRYWSTPGDRFGLIGFRCCLSSTASL